MSWIDDIIAFVALIVVIKACLWLLVIGTQAGF